MANSICNNCGKTVNWSAYRGSSIKDVRCSCGGTVRGLRTGLSGANKGKRFLYCSFCGDKKLDALTRTTKIPSVATYYTNGIDLYKLAVYEPGLPYCYWHPVVQLEDHVDKCWEDAESMLEVVPI